MRTALIVDDHPFIRSTVNMILKDQHFNVVAEADNGSDAVQLAREHKPDLVLLDISMPKLDGLEVLNRLYDLGPAVKVIVLTSLSPTFYSMRCMKAGAVAYVSKTHGLNELVRAINAVMSGHTFFPLLIADSVRRSDGWASELELIQRLSERELSIFQQLAKGMSNKQIGEEMLLSNKTISTYKARLIEKLNVSSLVHLADLAKRNELI